MHIYDLCKCLRERDHKPVILVWEPSRPSFGIIDGIRVHRIRMPSLFRATRYPEILYISLQVMSLIRKYGIDIIHAHDYLPGLASALVAKLLSKPIVVTFHLPIWSTSWISAYIPSEYFLKKLFLSSTNAIICVSKFTYEETLKLGFPSPKLKIIYNWPPRALECEMGILNDVLKKFDLHERPFILSVGRLAEGHKGFSMLISALRKLINKGYDLDLAIVGDGPDKEMYIKCSQKLGVKNRVHLLGYVPDEDLACLYKRCTAFALPSHFEGLPLVLLEAMSLGKPVVATRVGGTPEVIEDGKSGILVDPNSEDLASGIERLLSTPHLREIFRKRSQEILSRKFSKDNCYATIDFLERICRKIENPC